MKTITQSSLGYKVSTLLIFSGLIVSWLWALKYTPTDFYQGEVYRIIYVHVPSAFCAFFASFLLFCVSFLTFVKKLKIPYQLGQAVAEIGMLFTFLTLFTGAVWGKPTWGTWWTWDARLTTTFILALLYGGYLLLNASIESQSFRQRACAVLGVLIFLDVPIIYKSVSWWRTLHQPPSLNLSGSGTMDSEMLIPLVVSTLFLALSCLWLMKFRADNLLLRLRVESTIYNQVLG